MAERAKIGGSWSNVVTVDDLIADGYEPGAASAADAIEQEAKQTAATFAEEVEPDESDEPDEYEPAFAAELRANGLL